MNVEQINNAIAAHGGWKITLKDAIASGASTVDVARAGDCHACAFGQWLASLPAGERSSVHAKEVAELHAQFHVEAARVLAMALKGKKADATAAMAVDAKYSVTSQNLTRAMMKWKKA